MKNVVITLILAATVNVHAAELDCSKAATDQRNNEITDLRKDAQLSNDLNYIDKLIERLDLLYAVERRCLRANLSTIDGSGY